VVKLESGPISLDALVSAVRGDEDGAVALFLGTVRNHNDGRDVQRLEYHAYDEMALEEMRRVEQRACERFGVRRVAVVHRKGSLAIGEIAVAVAVASAHRAVACDACRFVIDTLKQTVPIWKKEFFEGGDVWIESPESRKG